MTGKRKALSFAFGVLCFLFIISSPSVANVARGISMEQCRAETGHILKVIQMWAQRNHCSVGTDMKTFWNHIFKINRWSGRVPYILVHANLANYFKMEDGAVSPIRTGKEDFFYNEFKRYISSHTGEKLSPAHILWIGMDACRNLDGSTNLPLAFLTIHNVIRALARPEQWCGPKMPGDYGHPPSDPMYPIFLDLLGKGRSTLPHIMRARGLRLRIGPNGVTDGTWSRVLFDNRVGVFQTLKGARNAMWDGGCHYYFGSEPLLRPFWEKVLLLEELFLKCMPSPALGRETREPLKSPIFTAGLPLETVSGIYVETVGGEQQGPTPTGITAKGTSYTAKNMEETNCEAIPVPPMMQTWTIDVIFVASRTS